MTIVSVLVVIQTSMWVASTLWLRSALLKAMLCGVDWSQKSGVFGGQVNNPGVDSLHSSGLSPHCYYLQTKQICRSESSCVLSLPSLRSIRTLNIYWYITLQSLLLGSNSPTAATCHREWIILLFGLVTFPKSETRFPSLLPHFYILESLGFSVWHAYYKLLGVQK